MPNDWKCVNTIPIYKSGDKSLISNYRPVALSSLICKVLEKIIVKSINSFTYDNGLLNPNQHGFVKRKSCVTQLNNITYLWSKILDRHEPSIIDALFLDMSKAFDKMPIDILLYKIATNFNIRGCVWKWISSYLTGRKQRVCFRGVASTSRPVTSGIPQGSCLGPILFNMFVNDVNLNVLSTCILFADDIVLYRHRRSANDIVTLQRDIDSLCIWANDNKMKFNVKKTKLMHITRKRSYFKPAYQLNGEIIETVDVHKYLGVHIDSKLSWKYQIDNVIARANRMVGFIFSVAGTCSPDAISCLYKALVLPILQYGLPAWAPRTAGNIDRIEKVQRRVSRRILRPHCGPISYDERLITLGWLSLRDRRLIILISFIFRCLYKVTYCNSVFNNIQVNVRHTESLTFIHPFARTDALKYTSIHNFPVVWSSLPPLIKDYAVVHPLKTFLFKFRKHILDNR